LCLWVVVQITLSSAALYCKDEAGNDVDWWISYKIPKLATDGNLGTGFSYAYFQGKQLTGRSKDIKGWKLSEKLSTDKNSLYGVTLAPLYASPTKYTSVMYNDDPPAAEGNTHWAHAKGVLALDKESGFWLIHSVPNFAPAPTSGYEYPDTGKLNGQTLLCISFKTSAEAENIAKQLVFMRPNIYNIDITDEVSPLAPSLNELKAKNWPKDSNQNIQDIKSVKGEVFTSFSRNSKAAADGDLYSIFVAPKLGADLLVETWRRGAGGPLTSNCTGSLKVSNVATVKLDLVDSSATSTGAWTYSSDHAKWAVSASATKPFACIGDINRMASQFKRGGGTVCMKSAAVWTIMRNSVDTTEACPK